MAVNKVVYAGDTLIDLSSDTVAPAGLLSGITAHDRHGDLITGTLDAGQPNCRYCEIALTANIGGTTGSHIIPIPDDMKTWLVNHYNTPGLTLSLVPRFQIMNQYSVMSTWATDSYVMGVTTYGIAIYNGTSTSQIGNATVRSQSDSVKTDARSNFAIRVNAEGEVSVWFNSAQYWIRSGTWVLTAWCTNIS